MEGKCTFSQPNIVATATLIQKKRPKRLKLNISQTMHCFYKIKIKMPPKKDVLKTYQKV
jgi:hypothetical protein